MNMRVLAIVILLLVKKIISSAVASALFFISGFMFGLYAAILSISK